MGISMNLVTYLVGDLHLPTSKSATIVTNFLGTLNLLALLAGFVADAKLGRYITVAISISITALVRIHLHNLLNFSCLKHLVGPTSYLLSYFYRKTLLE